MSLCGRAFYHVTRLAHQPQQLCVLMSDTLGTPPRVVTTQRKTSELIFIAQSNVRFRSV